MFASSLIVSLTLSSLAHAIADACTPALTPSYEPPTVAKGYLAHVVANGLTTPRSIVFDGEGALLVLESGVGVTALTLKSSKGHCPAVASRKTVVSNSAFNHGLTLSADGSTLYASDSDQAYSWDYDAKTQSVTSAATVLVTNMTNTDHSTRTLLLSKAAPGMLVVNRGSGSNVDPLASVLSSGHAQVKAFNISDTSRLPYDFTTSGTLLGWGVRNDVGIDEEPTEGGIFAVENSVDQLHRDGVDLHNTEPAEELNFFGYLDGTPSPNQGRNFGFPTCFTAWQPSTIPKFAGKVGQQFAIDNSTHDPQCVEAKKQAPRLAFHPHTAPLDILFNPAGSAAWITFHGSWDSTVPVGHTLGVVAFAHGQPVAPSTSKSAAVDVISIANISACGDPCLRPVGLAWSPKGGLFMSSDASGEIWAVHREDGRPVDGRDVLF